MASWQRRQKAREKKDREREGGAAVVQEQGEAGEDRGFESGVAFRGARSALSSREPGERETTCVPARRKKG